MLKNWKNKVNRIFDFFNSYSFYSNLVNRFSFLLLFFISSHSFFSQTVLYIENMENGAGATNGSTIATHETNNRFNEDGLTYSGSGDLRNTTVSNGYAGASGTFNVMLNNNAENLTMNGLNLTSCTSNIIISFGVYKGASAQTHSSLILEYSSNGTAGPWTAINYGTLPSGAGTTGWYLRTSTTVIPSTTNCIRWRSTDPTAGNEYRIDDITISCITTSITTGIVTGANFDVTCTTGEVGSVAFTSLGTYNTDNDYKVELSNSAGSFASPTLIGTLPSTANSGDIPITIPPGLTTSANYRVRVVSTDPVIIGSNSAAFTITLGGGPCNTITTGSTNAASYTVSCTAGIAGSVTFTSTGTFTAGNIYTAQLSDATGNFTSPSNIGTLASTANSGTINFGIPSGLSGVNYRVRVISSNPSTEGSISAVFTITLTGGPCGPLFLETFNEADNATSGVDNVGGVAWVTACPTCIVAGGEDYNKVEANELRIRDSNGPATFTTNSINISSCTNNFYIKVDINGIGNMEPCAPTPANNAIDFVAMEYRLNGGAFVGVPGHYNCGATDGFNSTVVIYDVAGAGSTTYNSGCLPPGNTVELRITAQNWAGAEYWELDNIEVGCNACVVLPIELTYFDASCRDDNSIVFSWQTASEKNNDYFALEQSIDGINYETITTIDGNGNTDETINYSYSMPYNRFIDYYYRLKQVDFDGNKNYSPIRTAQCDYDDDKISVFPNPTLGEFIVTGYQKEAQITIYDELGRLIENIQTSTITTLVNLSEKSAGVYFVKITSETKSETIKINLIH